MPANATITLGGNTVAMSSFTMTGSGASLRWNSTVGRIYRVSYKNKLTDPLWITAATITATGATTSWVDSTSTQSSQRFYLVAQIN